jgi:phosphohistidine phosphatase SixA
VPKVVGNKISERIIKNSKQGKPTHEKDQNFLMYDADIPQILQKLQAMKSAVLIASNPSIELWFLLHYKNQAASISTEGCMRQLSNRNKNTYKKGIIDAQLEVKLNENGMKACGRAKELARFNNPSSDMHVFIKELEKVKKNATAV